jgi:hypothetical protein
MAGEKGCLATHVKAQKTFYPWPGFSLERLIAKDANPSWMTHLCPGLLRGRLGSDLLLRTSRRFPFYSGRRFFFFFFFCGRALRFLYCLGRRAVLARGAVIGSSALGLRSNQTAVPKTAASRLPAQMHPL